MAQENHGLPPEVQIDHWNEATNVYMLVVCVSIWFLYYLRCGGRMMNIFARRNGPVVIPEIDKHQEAVKRVRLRQQLEHYYNVRRADQRDQKIDME